MVSRRFDKRGGGENVRFRIEVVWCFDEMKRSLQCEHYLPT